jgi:hypothetical protein
VPVPAPPAPKRTDDDDDLDVLPPLDGEGDEHEEPVPDLDADELLADDDDPFDDTTAEGDPVPDLETVEAEAGYLDGDEEDDDLDVGASEVIAQDDEDGPSLLEGNEEPDVVGDDFELDEATTSGHDAGEEGPLADDEALREEDLPSLDADEGGEAEDVAFFDALPEGDGDEAARAAAALPPWSKAPWGAAFARPAAGAVHAVACATRGALAAGRGIAAVDLEGAEHALEAQGLSGGDVTELCYDGALLVAATERGGVFVSADGGAQFAPRNAWRARVSAQEAASGLDLALGAGTLWGRTAQGKLLASADHGVSWELADAGGFVLAIAVDDRGRLAALVSALGGVEIVRGAPGALESAPVAAAVPEARPGVRAHIAAHGAAVAFAVAGGPARLAVGGQPWSALRGTHGAAALAFVDGKPTLLLATVAPFGGDGPDAEEPHVWLVRATGAEEPLVVARVDEGPASDAGQLALAWDEAHGVAWLGGAFGLFAFEPKLGT